MQVWPFHIRDDTFLYCKVQKLVGVGCTPGVHKRSGSHDQVGCERSLPSCQGGCASSRLDYGSRILSKTTKFVLTQQIRFQKLHLAPGGPY